MIVFVMNLLFVTLVGSLADGGKRKQDDDVGAQPDT